MGGFSNGYVPMFIVVGFQNKVYWNNNSENFETALKQAIDEMISEGVYVDAPFSDQIMLFEDIAVHDVSAIFKDLEDNPVTVTVDGISDPSIVTAAVENNIMTITAGNTAGGTATVTLRGTAGEFSKTDEFTVSVYDPANYTTESFETGDFNYLPWASGGNAPWTIDSEVYYDGYYSSRSGVITHNQKTQMSAVVEYPQAGKIMFSYKISTEAGYDHLKFFINGLEKKRMSGSLDWRTGEWDVEAGTNTFLWSYEKDSSTSLNSDCVWVDNIVFLGGTLTSIEENNMPLTGRLYRNYPNPFNPSTTISFDIEKRAEYSLKVYSSAGELVRTLRSGMMEAGRHSVSFEAGDLGAGIYFYTLETSDITIGTGKMLLVK